MSEVKTKVDFIQWLGPDMSVKVLTHLDDPCDLIRVSAVSSSLHRFVIENGLCKKLCLKMFPEISGVVDSIEVDNMVEPVSDMLGSYINRERRKRNHKVYAFLAFGLTPMMENCISHVISALTPDEYPDESIPNTLEPRDRIENWASYWSSRGGSNFCFPDTLVYELCSEICLVTEMHVQPVQAKAVRFRMGHSRYTVELDSNPTPDFIPSNHMLGVDQIIWTYTSPVFPMSQENQLQQFKLPEPVLCIGGMLLLELFGRFQIEEMGGAYHIRVPEVQVVGRPLSPAFDVKIDYPSGKCTLKYCPQTDS